MNVDTSEFPVVLMGTDDAKSMTIDEVLALFSALLERSEPFLFMSEGDMGGEGNRDGDVADRKKMSLWMKVNKAEIQRLIKGHIYVEPNAAKRLEAEAFVLKAEKFWGYPMFIVATTDKASVKAATLLAL